MNKTIFLEEEEKDERFWRKKIFFCRGEQNGKGKGGNIWRRRIYLFRWRPQTEKVKSSNCYPILTIYGMRDQ